MLYRKDLKIFQFGAKQPLCLFLKEEYDRLTQANVSFVEFMLKSPLVELRLNLRRDQSLTRNIDL